MTRGEISDFLVKQKGKSKEEVLANFASYCVIKNIPLERLGKMIQDLKSYSEWIWGD